MKLADKKTLKEIFLRHDVGPKKHLGQNFLIDGSVTAKICDNAELSKKDTVIEIGPGVGTLTAELAKRAGKVITVEKDGKMCEIMRETLKEFNNIEIINKDILDYDIPLRCYKVVANLPYYITSPVIRKLLEERYPPQFLLLTIQKEVAERITAKPPKMSILAVAVQFYANPQIIAHISKKAFWPAPSVSSSIIKITPKKEIPNKEFRKAFFKVVKKGFSHPRKQLLSNLWFDKKEIKGLNSITKEDISALIEKSGIEPTRRAESLSIEDWKSLTKNLSKII